MESRMRSSDAWQVTKNSLCARFEELLFLSQWTDCAFSVGTETVEVIKCHKLVLAASSPVFEALFFGGLSETEVIRVPDVEPNAFRLMLKYIYSDNIDLQNLSEAAGLLYLSKKYLLPPHLSRICLDYLIKKTCIRTLWDMIAIAESLDENELLDRCIKVMSGHPFEYWYSEDGQLSKNTLLKLLDQRCMNMKEVEIWSLVVEWARKQIILKDGTPTPEKLREALDSIGALSKIYFLVFTHHQFIEYVANSGILSAEECNIFESLIREGQNTCYQFNQNIIPSGFSAEAHIRSPQPHAIWKCTREVLDNSPRNRMSVDSDGPSREIEITSHARVLIMGFEIATRCTPRFKRYPAKSPHLCYREQIVMVINDSSGSVISKIDHDNTEEFNSFQILTLSRPIWFEAGEKYSVEFILSSGSYPVPYMAESTKANGTSFKFFDCLKCHSRQTGSFVNSIFYSF